MSSHGTVSIEVQVAREVRAGRVDLYLEISGSSIYSGDTALKKAHEVRELVTALGEIGLKDDQIQLAGVQAKVSSGIVSKASTAKYRLIVKLPNLETVADALGVVTSVKNAKLCSMEWHYDGMDDIRNEMLSEALRKAQRRASVASQGIGQEILGVGSMTEKYTDPDEAKHVSRWGEGEVYRGMRARVDLDAVSPEALGLDVIHSKRVYLDVRVVYQLQPKDSG